MQLFRRGWLALAVSLPLSANAIIDVSGHTTQVLNTGDALLFDFAGSNFRTDAALFGVAAYPTLVRFSFVSATVHSTGSFSASISSADGSFAVPFLGPLSFAPATFRGASYSGPVSTISGVLDLSASESQELFGGGAGAVLTLLNDGPAVTVGLAGYTLTQDFYGTLSGGGLSVGTWATATDYIDPPPVPEPSSEELFVGGGVLLCALWAGLKRMSPTKHQIQ